MKLVLPIFVLVLISACGKTGEVKPAQSLGKYIDAVVTPIDANTQDKAMVLCQALANKDTTFRTTYLNDYTKFNFTTSLQSCVGTEQTSQVVAKLRLASGQLEYNLVSGNYFSTQIETFQQGVISAVCSRLFALTQPIKISEDTLVQYEFSSGAQKCSSDNDIQCITMRTAFRQDSGRYMVTMEDKFFVNTKAGTMKGMVGRHERYDLATCTGGKMVKNISNFTGITN